MAYLIVSANGQEIDRKPLGGATIVGRAPECGCPVRDILLSRRHCVIEPTGHAGEWIVTDLGSKNGTYVDGARVTRRSLKDSDELMAGRTVLTFRTGAFVAAPPGAGRPGAVVRPADPADALAGTVEGFTLVEPGEVERQAGAPIPQPRPSDPSAFENDDVHGLIEQIMSSSWDSIMAEASLPVVRERAPVTAVAMGQPRIVSRKRVSFCLQADSDHKAVEIDDAAEAPANVPSAPPTVRRSRWRWSRPSRLRIPRVGRQDFKRAGLTLACAGLTVGLVGAWVAAVSYRQSQSDEGVAVAALIDDGAMRHEIVIAGHSRRTVHPAVGAIHFAIADYTPLASPASYAIERSPDADMASRAANRPTTQPAAMWWQTLGSAGDDNLQTRLALRAAMCAIRF